MEKTSTIITENLRIEKNNELVRNVNATYAPSDVIAEGALIIKNKNTNEILVDKKNAIHPENFAEALARSMMGDATGFIAEMHFGNGGTIINGVGAVTYLAPNVSGDMANLYNVTYYKNISNVSVLNTDKENNKIEFRHIRGSMYADLIITCLLDFGEPQNQEAFDDAPNTEGTFIFDEIGLKAFGNNPGSGKLLTHVIFNPVQKSLNRQIEIIYTIRISLC